MRSVLSVQSLDAGTTDFAGSYRDKMYPVRKRAEGMEPPALYHDLIGDISRHAYTRREIFSRAEKLANINMLSAGVAHEIVIP